MQKVILDTNVIVSALISSAAPSRIVYELVLTERVEHCLSEEVFAEYVEVLNRDKFVKYLNFKLKAEIVLSKIKEVSTFYQTGPALTLLKDTSDNKFLELAAASAADFLITGNTLDFTITEFECTKIMSPKSYWDNYSPKG